MEILGLAIVIVLMLVATIFVVRFLVLKSPTEYRKGFVSSELASNMLNTLLKTAAIDCSQARSITCDNGEESCQHTESIAKNVFTQTLDKWSMQYEFLAYTDPKSPLIKLGKTCKAEKRSKIFPIPISTATMYTKLDICD